MLRGTYSSLATLAVAAATIALVAGCGDKKQDISAANSQYAPATAGDDFPSEPAATDREGSAPADRSPLAPAAAPREGANLGANGQKANQKTPPPRSAAKDPAGALQLPDGGAPELLAHIEKLNEDMGEILRSVQGTGSIDPVKPQLERNLNAQVAAADKVLSLDPEEDLRVEAIYAKGKALHARLQIGAKGAEKDLRAMLVELEGDENSDVKRLTSAYRLEIPLVQLQTGQSDDAAPVMAGLADMLQHADLTGGAALQDADKAVQTFLALERDEDAVEAMKVIRSEIEKSGNLPLTVDAMSLSANYLEQIGRLEEAEEVYNTIEQKAAGLDEPQAQEQIAKMLETAKKRLGLMGKEIKVEDMIDLEGDPIDWSKYQGKVVLVDFWATWCGPCLKEFRNIAQVHQVYNEHGFEVIGVNVDDEMEPVQEFFGEQRLPWTIAFPDDPEKRGFANPLANESGVETIPFMMLLDQEGKVAALHTRGPRLEKEVRRLLKLTDEDPAAEKAPAAEKTPAAETPADANDPSADPPPQGKKASPKSDAAEPELDLPLQPANDAPKAAPDGNEGAAAAAPSDNAFFVYFAGDDQEGDSEATTGEAEKVEAVPPTRNPYLAERNLSTFELVEYLQDMEDKPRVIQQRPGFAEAVAEAADRVLAAPDAKEKFQVLAALTKIKFLHDRASFGDEKSDAALAAFIEKMKDDPREKIAGEIKMLQLERRALDADQLEAAENEKLLADLKTWFEEHRQELGEKHLRMASACVGAINKIEDGDEREKLFGEFGSLFASSSNKELARYGKRLSKAPSVSALVGKPLELDGLTDLGTPFDWQAYRGKVVLVDFWATWCGPCRKAIPGLKEFYEANRESGFDVVGVNLDEDPESLAEFLDQQKLPWSNLVGEDGTRLADKYGIGGLPSFILVDREGNVLDVSHSLEALQPKIEELLKAS